MEWSSTLLRWGSGSLRAGEQGERESKWAVNCLWTTSLRCWVLQQVSQVREGLYELGGRASELSAGATVSVSCSCSVYSSSRGRKERRQGSWVAVMTRAIASATELIQQLAWYIYPIAIRITVVWHVSSLQLAGGSSRESVNKLMEKMTSNSRVSKTNLKFWAIHSQVALCLNVCRQVEVKVRREQWYCLLTAHTHTLLFSAEKVLLIRHCITKWMDVMQRNWDLHDCLKQRVACQKRHPQTKASVYVYWKFPKKTLQPICSCSPWNSFIFELYSLSFCRGISCFGCWVWQELSGAAETQMT